MLTETEKSLDAYKSAFSTLAVREKLAFYIATDLNNDATDLLSTWSSGSQTTCDLSALYASTEVTNLISSINTNLTAVNIPVTLNNVKSNNTTAEKLQAVMNNTLSTTTL